MRAFDAATHDRGFLQHWPPPMNGIKPADFAFLVTDPPAQLLSGSSVCKCAVADRNPRPVTGIIRRGFGLRERSPASAAERPSKACESHMPLPGDLARVRVELAVGPVRW